MNRPILCYFVFFLLLSGCSKNEISDIIKPSLVIEKDIYEYLNTDVGNTIFIEGNVEWTASLIEEKDWITVTKSGDLVQLIMTENATVNDRIAKINIASVNNDVNKIIIIKQHGNTPTLIVDKTSFAINDKAATLEVNVSSNMEWTATSSADWGVAVIDGGKIKIAVQPNTGSASRTAVIAVKGELPMEDKKITIIQEGSIKFKVDKTSLTFTRESQTLEVLVTTELDWTFTSNSTWFTAVKDGNKLKITTSTNNFLERLGSVVLKTDELDITVSVKQSGHGFGNELDRQVLIAIYNNFGGASTNTGWDITQPLSPATIASWNGVTLGTINGVSRVTKIDLTGKALVGEIPVEIGYLSELTELRFVNTYEIKGTIPSTIGNLAKLRVLLFSRNKLTGSIPVEFGNLTELRDIAIHTNQLNGSLPVGVFGKLINLNTFEMRQNKLTGAIPADLLAHPKWAAKWGTDLCNQQAGFGFTNCP